VSEEKSAVIAMIEAHEEFVQHVETGSARVRTLSVVTILVAGLLLVSYAYQLALPYATGTTSVTISLTDPALQAVELVIAVLTVLWLYVGMSDFVFTGRMTKAIGEARSAEKDIERRLTAQ
jgi:hypothetical protein